MRPVIVERLPGLASLATAQSMEAFRAQFIEPENLAMMSESIRFYERFGDETGLQDCDIGMRQQGYLFLTTQEDGPERFRGRVAAQQALGLGDVEYLDGGEARRRFPFVSGPVTAATWRAKDGWLSAHEAAYGFATASGAIQATGVTVTGFRRDAERVRSGAGRGAVFRKASRAARRRSAAHQSTPAPGDHRRASADSARRADDDRPGHGCALAARERRRGAGVGADARATAGGSGSAWPGRSRKTRCILAQGSTR
ncbi:MAG: FAD-dependent oxidoreductase [Anaerolineae bacterium]|nr:FAD-dependent oxidoreductase [Anaerolineae bacterium]